MNSVKKKYNTKKVVCIQGLGFVGSAMAVATSSRLNKNKMPIFDVIGIDQDTEEGIKRINKINTGKFPFETEDNLLSVEIKKSNKRGNLVASSDISLYSKADIVLVSINCDLKKEESSSKILIQPFLDSVSDIAKNISEDTLVIIESTVPPGTTEKLIFPIFKTFFKKRKLDINKFFIAHSYERVMPGKNYLNSIINYWRVYAGINEQSANKCKSFLSNVVNVKKYPLSRLKNIISSETGKVLENSYRAVNIAFMEEWGRFAEQTNIDLYEVINAIRLRSTHENMRQPGFGVGGYCLTKDPLFAKISSRDILNLKGHEFPFSSKAVQVNNKMPLVSFDKIKTFFRGKVKNKSLLLLGVSYRQDVGDTRFSPSEVFILKAIKEGLRVKAFDPFVQYWEELNLELEPSLPDPSLFDIIFFAVPHKKFKKIEISKWIKNKSSLIFDANNVLNKNQIKDIETNNYNLISIGKG